jgi:hypothetical protein|tara:strand:- start:644 stop:796 length:153 start_codon:yes stop_codon:yes gene_type:complete
MEVLMCLFVVLFIIFLCRYVMSEGYKRENEKQFLHNLENFDKKEKENETK